jgi:predicted nucleic-acid-binding protein
MSDRRLVDTNLVVRFLVQDHPNHGAIATKLFDACDRGETILILLPFVLAECVFVLESFYQHPRTNIASTLTHLITSPGVEIDNPDICTDALVRYQKTKCHFVDCLLAATAAAEKLPIATLDTDFRKFPDVQVKVD